MQPVNDDMDNLFRRAAQDYPLNTHAPNFDFNKVKQQMDAEEVLPEKQEHRRRYLWLLLLMPLSFVLDHHFSHTAVTKQGTVQQHTGASVLTSDKLPRQSAPITGDTITASIATNNRKPISTDQENRPATIIEKENSKKEADAITVTSSNHPPKQQPTQASFTRKKPELPETNTTTYKAIVSRTKRNQKKFVQSGVAEQWVKNKTRLRITDTGENRNTEKEKEIVLQTTNPAAGADTTGEHSIIDSLKNTALQQADSSGKKVDETAKKKDSTDRTTTQKSKMLKADKQKGFVYIGLVAGPDFSVVKSLKTGGTGYNAGLVGGYRLGRHWAIESGIIWDYKKYYADGKYVTTTKLALLPHSEVLYVDGSCGMIEIPLKVQYHFGQKRNHEWYAATGLSSYIMKKEDYYYLYKRYNMQYYSDKEYSNSSNNWLSVLQLSIGYQLQLKHTCSLRIEPYVKFPVSGIGIGNLPLSGAGINIGFIRSLK